MILDTNGLSALAEGEPALESLLRKATQAAIPVIVLGEYRHGISQSRYRKLYEEWLHEYLPKFRVLDIDEQTTFCYSAIRTELKKAGTLIPSNDIWIAALCRQHSVPLLSRDRHFDAVRGIRRLEW
ncbi:type II toxin-antitoxin system VapC family toxin [Alloacidobacterium sp.]|uniref:type II toxin-antitoxin system VapC family toxin n=1 Tax=Alloacidobacterium sp. TaxID=2951999 RepID=UPI002D396D26|nr:type II toxin-antitoxin system VapC family toxin [Alloacidobacterium sp.]HYK36565.1 type II toxin-antitoxin system VapC family toxin [Alloacidobacterium sp.]